ncbi:MAG: hypothetical protein LBE35_07405 [Clostridiales bacterium]|nr:hypothetical protein [Clostridiales bacterium]
MGVSDLYGFIENNTRTGVDDALGVIGENIEITFAPGYSAENFVFGGGYDPVPVVVRASFLEEHGYNLGDYLLYLSLDNPPIAVKVIGYFEHGLSRAVNTFASDMIGEERSVVVMPLNALVYYSHDAAELEFENWDLGGLLYKTVRITLNTARNREIDSFYEMIEPVLLSNNLGRHFGSVPLELLMDDSELRNAIEPMEQNLALLQLLYPVALAAAVVLSIGLSLVLMLQNIKTAAIMRILGKTKTSSQLMLCAEQILICIVGVMLGLATLAIIGVPALETTPLMLAGLYFAGATLGSIIGALTITTKTPLELLQARYSANLRRRALIAQNPIDNAAQKLRVYLTLIH